jgi:hypothetical protein
MIFKGTYKLIFSYTVVKTCPAFLRYVMMVCNSVFLEEFVKPYKYRKNRLGTFGGI